MPQTKQIAQDDMISIYAEANNDTEDEANNKKPSSDQPEKNNTLDEVTKNVDDYLEGFNTTEDKQVKEKENIPDKKVKAPVKEEKAPDQQKDDSNETDEDLDRATDKADDFLETFNTPEDKSKSETTEPKDDVQKIVKDLNKKVEDLANDLRKVKDKQIPLDNIDVDYNDTLNQTGSKKEATKEVLSSLFDRLDEVAEAVHEFHPRLASRIDQVADQLYEHFKKR